MNPSDVPKNWCHASRFDEDISSNSNNKQNSFFRQVNNEEENKKLYLTFDGWQARVSYRLKINILQTRKILNS